MSAENFQGPDAVGWVTGRT